MEINWDAMLGATEADRPKFVVIPCGQWRFGVTSAQYRVEERESKNDPEEKWKSRSVLFELIPIEQISGDIDAGAAMTDENKVDQKKWHRIDLRKGTDITRLQEFLESIGSYDPNIPLVSENGGPDCLKLLGKDGKYPEVIAEVLPHRARNGDMTTKLGDAITPYNA